jgi:RHS repeat-associated protein
MTSQSEALGIPAWGASSSYSATSVVSYNGRLYRAVSTSTGAQPDTSPAVWKVFDPAAGASGESGDLSQVKGRVNCIAPIGPGRYSAVFGYTNATAATVTEAIGTLNFFQPTAESTAPGRGQPTAFLSGIHDGAFAVEFNGQTLTWMLAGQQAISTTNSAAPVPLCTTTQGPDGPQVTFGSSPPLLVHPDPSTLLTGSVVPGGNVGALPDHFAVSDDGAADYSIELWSPPARMGIGPKLSLSYSSRSGRGSAGMGWNVGGFGISRVTRCHTTVAQDGDSAPIDFSNGDALCLDGQRLIPTNQPAINGAIPYATEHDPFTRVLMNVTAPFSFVVQLPDGRELSYGATANSRHAGPRTLWAPTPEGVPTAATAGDAVFVYAWALDSARDALGNRMDVTYQRFTDDAEALATSSCTELLPSQIAYTAGPLPSQPALRQVLFSYEKPASSEPSCKYVAGFGLGSQMRLRQIVMAGPGASTQPIALRSYTLSYHQSAITQRSLLDSVRECDGTNKVCLPSTTFEYEAGSDHYEQLSGPLASLYTADKHPTDIRFADLNGDGRDDILFSYFATQDTPIFSGVEQRGYALSQGWAFGPPVLYVPDDNEILAGVPPASTISYGPATGSNGSLVTHFVNTLNKSCDWWGNTFNCSKSGLSFDDLDLTTNAWSPNLHLLDAWAPFVIGDFDGNGTQDLIGSEPTSGGTSWKYWLNRTNQAPTQQTMAMSTLTDAARPLTVSPKEGLEQYVTQLDGTGKTAFLFHQGVVDSTGTHDDPNFIAVVANASTGAFSSRETTLAVGPDLAADDSNAASTFRYLFIDLNADGNTDALRIPGTGGTPQVALNTGAGFGPFVPLPGGRAEGQYQFPATAPSSPGVDPRQGTVRVVDLNGDGLPDVLIANNSQASSGAGPIAAYFSRGAQGVQGSALNDDAGQPIQQGGADPATPEAPWGVETLDIDGDGLTDVYANGNVFRHKGKRADMLVAIHDGLSKDTAIAYEPIAPPAMGLPGVYTPGTTCLYPQECIKSGIWVVSKYSVSAEWGPAGKPQGQAGSSMGPAVDEFTFQYTDGRSDARGRGWLGFAQKTMTESDTNATTVTTFDNTGTDTGFGYALARHPQSVVTTAPISGSAYRVSRSDTQYQLTPTLGGRGVVVRPLLVSSIQLENLGTPSSPSSGGSTLSNTKTAFQYDAFGNLLQRSTTWSNGDQTTQSSRYDQNQANGKWLLSLLRSHVDSSQIGWQAIGRYRELDTDPATGLVRSESIQRSDGATVALAVSYDRNAFGQVIHSRSSAVDPLTSAPLVRENWTTYDAFDGIFPSSETNALGHTTRSVYHPGLGVLVYTQDPNGAAVHARYDGFGHPVYTKADGQGATTVSYSNGRPYLDVAPGVSGLYSVETITDGAGHSLVTYNANHHEVVHGELNHDGSFVYTEKNYADPLYGEGLSGTLASISRPHSYASPQVLTRFSYDQLRRPIGALLPDFARTSALYQGLATTLIDARGFARTSLNDEQGRLVRVDEDSVQNPSYDSTLPYTRPSTAISTNYNYGFFDQLDSISITAQDAHGGATTKLTAMQYDVLGRRTSLIEADSGTSVATYNAFGEPTSTGDANNQVHILGRDSIGRVVADYSTQDGTNYFQWDSGVGAVGKIIAATSADQITTSYTYDLLGRQTSTSWDTPSGSFRVDRALDAYGRIAGIRYPSIPGVGQLLIKYGFDAVGTPSNVISNDAKAPLSWAAVGWQTDGHVTSEMYGKSATSGDDSGMTSRSYDPNRGWLKGIATGGATIIQQLSYDYDASGNLRQRNDGIAGTQETFHNDFARRLDTWTYASAAGSASTVFGYSDLGNLNTRATIGSLPNSLVQYASGTRDAGLTPGAAGVHAVVSDGVNAYGYDAKGNQTSAPGRSVSYTSFDLPRAIDAGTTTAFRYDAWHKRVMRTGATSTVYADGVYERRTSAQGVDHVFYVPGGGRSVAQIVWSTTLAGVGTGKKVVYLHDDHLGSTESISGLGAPTEHFKYDPFGKRIDAQTLNTPPASTSGVTTGFTGQEAETDGSGLINMRGRMYDPMLGRLLSPDPLVANSKSSQGFNRYSYVYNNPLNLVDPTGFYGTGFGTGGSRTRGFGCDDDSSAPHFESVACNPGLLPNNDGTTAYIGFKDGVTSVSDNLVTLSADGASNYLFGTSDSNGAAQNEVGPSVSRTAVEPPQENPSRGMSSWGASSVDAFPDLAGPTTSGAKGALLSGDGATATEAVLVELAGGGTNAGEGDELVAEPVAHTGNRQRQAPVRRVASALNTEIIEVSADEAVHDLLEAVRLSWGTSDRGARAAGSK